MIYLSSYFSDYFNTIYKINQYYRDKKPVGDIDALFVKAEFLENAISDELQGYDETYHHLDNIDDECILDGSSNCYIVRGDDRIFFYANNGDDTNLVADIVIPKSVVDLTFTDGHGTLKSEMSVAKAMQRMNTLRNRIEEYKINRKAYNYEQYNRQSVHNSTSQTTEV